MGALLVRAAACQHGHGRQRRYALLHARTLAVLLDLDQPVLHRPSGVRRVLRANVRGAAKQHVPVRRVPHPAAVRPGPMRARASDL